jgi:hypothetical protein
MEECKVATVRTVRTNLRGTTLPARESIYRLRSFSPPMQISDPFQPNSGTIVRRVNRRVMTQPPIHIPPPN